MDNKKIFISYLTIVRKETIRFFRIWTQTLLPSAVTSILYFVIFGAFIGSQVRPINGLTYMQFIVPGLIMMSVITNAFANVVGSFFGAKFQRNIEELMISPTPPWVIIAGFVTGGVLRGLVVGGLILLISLFFTQLSIVYLGVVIIFMILTAVLFSLAGLLNGLFANNFDQIAIILTFILTPLTYLGGVFYSINALPPFWKSISYFNPILYMVDGFRYGFYGFSDVNIVWSFIVIIMVITLMLWLDWFLLEKGIGLKN